MTLAASYEADKAVAGVATALRAVADLREGNVRPDDVIAARERLLASWRERMATVEGAAAIYAEAILLGVDSEGVRDLPARLARVGREDVVRVANQYLRDGVVHVVFIGDDRRLDVGPLGMGGAATLP